MKIEQVSHSNGVLVSCENCAWSSSNPKAPVNQARLHISSEPTHTVTINRNKSSVYKVTKMDS